MAQLTLNLLGPFEARLEDDRRLQLPTVKVQALLAFLLVEEAQRPGTRHQRLALMTLLWPDTAPESARNNLRQTLYRLCQLLPDVQSETGQTESFLLSDRQSVWVNPHADYRLDVATFEQSLQKVEQLPGEQEFGERRTSFLSSAIDVYRGDFLSDLYVADSDEFEQWAEQTREHVRRQMLRALKQRFEHELAGGDYERAVEFARRHVAIDYLDEAGHRQLMEALAYSGQRSNALAHYAACCEMLLVELGVEPGAQMQQLAETIKQGEFEPQPWIELRSSLSLPIYTESLDSAPSFPPPVPTAPPMLSARGEETASLPRWRQVPSESGGRVSVPVKRDDAQLILLRKVKNFWIEDVLEQTLKGYSPIELTKEVRPEAIRSPWEKVVTEPTKSSWTLPEETGIVELFDDTARALLILGAPGSGKTITLLTLARTKIIEAETDPTRAVPVVFNLSSWPGQSGTLTEWLVEELNEKYLIPKKLGRGWIVEDQLLLLLDGLDEVAPSRILSCVIAINQFRRENGLTQMVVCGRTDVYEALDEKLWMDRAVCLQPLSQAQTDAHLRKSATAPSPLHLELVNDPGLQEMMRSPLMLNLLVSAYPESASPNFPEPGSVASRRTHLFATYVDQMIRRRGQEDQFAAHDVVHHLSWVVEKMSQHDESIFLIEQLQDSWLTTKSRRWLFGFLSMWIVFGLFVTLYTLIFSESAIPSAVEELLPSVLLSTTLVV